MEVLGALRQLWVLPERADPYMCWNKHQSLVRLEQGFNSRAKCFGCLDRLGVLKGVHEYSVFPQRFVYMDAVSGEVLTPIDFGKSFQDRYGYPYIVLHRSDLHKVLLDACLKKKNITLHTNQQVISVQSQSDKKARVICQDGTTYIAEALVGADGLWSKTRQLFSDDKPVCSEFVAYRGTIPMSESHSVIGVNSDDVLMWIGPNLHLVQYPVRRGELYNQVVVFKSNHYKEGSDDWGTPEEMDERFSICCPQVRKASTFTQRQRRWQMSDRDPIHNWTSGNITMLGDAAHPMLQYLAQGGCQALEDAACLTEILLKEPNIGNAFLSYQQERIPRTEKVQLTARTWSKVIHTEDPITKALRNIVMNQRKSDDYTYLDWLYTQRYM